MLVVAVHDVARSTLPEVRWLLDALDAAGVTRRVLKVVPAEPRMAEPGAAAAGADAELQALVAAEAAKGSEVVVHGWTHRANGPLVGAAADRLRARLFAGGAAEFCCLTPAERDARLTAGVAWLAALGIAPSGFCPPAWLATPGLDAAARGAGFRYVAYLRGLRDLRRERWLSLPPIGHLGAGSIQEGLAQVGALLVARPLAAMLHAPARRIVLHPQGAARSGAVRRALDEARRLAQRHACVTYGELLDG